MHILGPAVPVLTLLTLWGLFLIFQQDWRTSFLSAAIVCGAIVVAVSEVLSLFHAITFWGVLGGWGLCLLAGLALCIRFVGKPRDLVNALHLPPMPLADRLLLAGGALILIAVGVLAWVAPPNTVDSLTYHMPRVMHWIQDRSLDFYPTHVLRQLYLNGGAELIVLHLQILRGSDRLANLVQWASMLGCAVGVSLIAQRLGANLRGQVLSSVASLTIPMGILQASSTQTDYVTAFWLVCFVYWMASLSDRGGAWRAALGGTALGLAALTKSTAYLYALPFLLWFVCSVVKLHRTKAIAGLIVAGLAFILVNLGTYIRDQELFGNPLGITREPSINGYYSNEVFSAQALASNVLRNVSVHLGTPWPSTNGGIERGIAYMHRLLSISENDPRTTWVGTAFQVRTIHFSEDTDGNLLHFLLICWASLFIVLGLFRPRRDWSVLLYWACLAAGFLIFCLLLKWQPWGSRLQLPLFVLFSAILGKLGGDIESAWAGRIIAAVLLLAAIPWVLLNHTRPLIGPENVFAVDRTSQYFVIMPKGQYLSAARALAASAGPRCSQIGLYIGENDAEYLFWVAMQQTAGNHVSFEAVNVNNLSNSRYAEFPEIAPCGILARSSEPLQSLHVAGTNYRNTYQAGSISVLLPTP